MFKKILLLSTYILGSFSLNCYTNNIIANSNSLFSYKGNVYDLTNYIHPKCVNISKLIGNDLEIYINSNSLSFHLQNSIFFSDLQKILVGELKICCNTIPTTLNTTTKPYSTSYTIPTTLNTTTKPYSTSYTSEIQTTTPSEIQTTTPSDIQTTTPSDIQTTTTEEYPFINNVIISKPMIIINLSILFISYCML